MFISQTVFTFCKPYKVVKFLEEKFSDWSQIGYESWQVQTGALNIWLHISESVRSKGEHLNKQL